MRNAAQPACVRNTRVKQKQFFSLATLLERLKNKLLSLLRLPDFPRCLK